MIPHNNNVEHKSKIFPFIVAYTSKPSVPMTCDRTSSRHPLTTDVDEPAFPLTKNWTGWTLCCASKVPDWTQLLAPSNAAAALATSTVSTTASLTSLQLMKNWCLSVQRWRSTGRTKILRQGPIRSNLNNESYCRRKRGKNFSFFVL